MFKKNFIAFLLTSSVSIAQNHQKSTPVFHEISNQKIVQSIFPDAVKVEKINSYWYRVLDKSQKTLGFALSSADYCQDIKGYNDVTPVLIITDKKFIIKKVALQSNHETLSYTLQLENKGFFNSWSGKTVKEAKSSEVDGHTGATYTANAVIKNVEFLLTNGAKKMPEK
jgi:hypothetical protein